MMNAIVASYASSDSDDEIHSGQDSMWSVHNTQPGHESIRSVQNLQQHNQDEGVLRLVDSTISAQDSQQRNYSQEENKVKLPVLSKKRLSLHTSQSVRDIPVLVNDNSQYTGGIVNQGVMKIKSTKRTNAGIEPQQNSNITTLGNSVPCVKKTTVMPYIPKAKRTKHASKQQSTDGISSNDFLNSPGLVFKKAKLFANKNISRYYAPKRRVIHFDAHQGCINRISWNPCFQDFLLSASMDGVVKIWNVETTPSCVQQVSGHTQAVKDAKWNKDGVNALSGGYDKFSRITDVNAGNFINLLLLYIMCGEMVKVRPVSYTVLHMCRIQFKNWIRQKHSV